MSQNHYQVLGVAASAPAAEIKRAYRRLVVQYHPDKHGGDVRYEDQFKAVAAAYHVLGDPGRRATYDFQLAQAARRAEEARRQQQYRPASQHVYGVPMPPAQPIRTRSPAGSRERHYQTIPKRSRRFTRRDWALTILLPLACIMLSLGLKAIMDRVTATSHYERGLRAYGHGEWWEAYKSFEAALHSRPDMGSALRRRGEIEQYFYHDPAAARAHYEAALLEPQPPRVAADMLWRMGQCETILGQPDTAELSYSRALALDSTLSAAYLARGEGRLLNLPQSYPEKALADLSRGLALRERAGQPPAWPAVQLMGLALARLGRSEEARATYLRVLEAWPNDGRTHFLLGRLAEQAGDQTMACGYFERAVALGFGYAESALRACKNQLTQKPETKQPPTAEAVGG